MSDTGYSDPDGMLGVFPLPVTPSDVSPGDTTPLRADVSAAHDHQHNKKASIVDYNDENEQLNSDFQLIFDQHAQIGRHSSWRYDKVAALLISWDGSCDDLNTKGEVDNLARMFRETYKYKVQNSRLDSNGPRHPQLILNKTMADFVFDEDGPSTLLLVYYAGHGAPGSRPGNLELRGESRPSINNAATIVWNHPEANLQETEADIFEIFDCCYAGDLGRGSCGRGFGTRCFEFLGATSSGATTKIPGPGSFTTALIWALGVLAKETDKFTTSTLVAKIKEAPNFPKRQVPVLTERNDLSTLQRIVIAPLLDAHEASTAVPADEQDTTRRQPWGFLNLRFSLESCPEKAEIAKFGMDVRRILQSTELKVQGVKWAGFYRSLPNVGIYPRIVHEAVRKMLHIGRKRRISSASQSSPGALSSQSAMPILQPAPSHSAGRLLSVPPSGWSSLRRATYHFDMGFRSVVDCVVSINAIRLLGERQFASLVGVLVLLVSCWAMLH